MTNKYIVEIYLPAAQKSFDMKIPVQSRMSEINMLAAAIASELSEGSFKAGDSSFLADAVNGRILDVNMTALELGIQNGSKLILI